MLIIDPYPQQICILSIQTWQKLVEEAWKLDRTQVFAWFNIPTLVNQEIDLLT